MHKLTPRLTLFSNHTFRPYSIQSSPSSSSPAHDHWPAPTPPNKHPTPYQILSHHPHAPYVRSDRFYELVKLYHPDRHVYTHRTRPSPSPSSPPLLSSTLTERYRLVCLAHEILSTPHLRRAYDAFGAGWVESGRATPSFAGAGPPSRDSVMRNATWEDWERWAASEAGEGRPHGGDPPPGSPWRSSGPGRQQPRRLHMANGTVAGILLVGSIVGGAVQQGHAAAMAKRRAAEREAEDRRAREGWDTAVERARGEGSDSRKERLEGWVAGRAEAVPRGRGVKNMLVETDICGSGIGSSKDFDMRRKWT